MKEMYTGKQNEEADSRAEEKRPDFDVDTRGSRETGSQSQRSWLEQERTNRENSQRSSLIGVGAAIAGGMLDHLIDDYDGQVEAKQQEIQRLNEDINRCSDEIKHLKFRIQELKSLRKELQQQIIDKQ